VCCPRTGSSVILPRAPTIALPWGYLLLLTTEHHRSNHQRPCHKAARLDHSHDEELRKLIRVDLLIVDDFALTQLDEMETQDVYDIVVERHLRTSTIVTSNRGPDEWLATFADPVRAQSAIDRFTSNSYDLVIEGESYRSRLKPRLHPRQEETM
jgi:hypothetical protein